MRKRIIFSAFVIFSTMISCSKGERLIPAKPEEVHLKGELLARLHRNFDRLESELYRPDTVFHSSLSASWPGDCEGRIVLGLVSDARATGREPLYLDTILDHYAHFMNRNGYFGPLYDGTQNEQQMSGNGWVLRGLCEYYEWKSDERVLGMIRDMVSHYFLKSRGIYKNYPIDPEERKAGVGGVIGEEISRMGDWLLSSDIGSVFNGMEGLIHAYSLIGTEELKAVSEELVNRFLEIDLAAIRAQTHSSLTACRGVLRYAVLTGDDRLVGEIQKRWEIYKEYGMTPGYQNFNWFCREDTWSEPCAVVDSYLLAMQLWQLTGRKDYLDDAERIYYNGLCHAQRANGGFGCDVCPSEKTGRRDLAVRIGEAFWCCTMRGAEGLGCAQRYTFFTRGKELFVPTYRACTYDKGDFALEEDTSYPFEGKAVFRILRNQSAVNCIQFCIPVNSESFSVMLNGKCMPTTEEKGFCCVCRKFKEGDTLIVSFEMPIVTMDDGKTARYFTGPLLLGKTSSESKLKPIYHLMDSVVVTADYHNTVLFPSEK